MERANKGCGSRMQNRLSRLSAFHATAKAGIMVGCCIVLLHCGRPDSDTPEPVALTPRTLVRDGYTIQLFPTPEEQLRYAKRWFYDLKEKRAVLEALIENFHDARRVRAEAELELAYLALGTDYRFANPRECRLAIGHYKEVLESYEDLPDIRAKAIWYIGWILSDLLDEPQNAASYYQKVVDEYPNVTLSIKPPVPWVSLVLPQVEDRPQAVYARRTYYWASISLLQLVRIHDDEKRKWSAFEKLYSDYRSSLATAYAIRDLLKAAPEMARKTLPLAKKHLESMLFHRSMAREISRLIDEIERTGTNPPPTSFREAS